MDVEDTASTHTAGKRRFEEDEEAGDAAGGGDADFDFDAHAAAAPAKRPREGDSLALISRENGSSNSSALALVTPGDIFRGSGVFAGGRTSRLQAPIMELTGHSASATSVQFSPDGACLASSSTDRSILLWRTYGDCENYGILRGHKNAVLHVCWTSDGASLASASADKTVGLWDAESGVLTRSLKGHTRIVNAVATAPARTPAQGSSAPASAFPSLIASVSDDCSVRLWDTRSRSPAASATLSDKYPLLGVALSSDGETVYSGGVDGVVRVWDVRRGAVLLSLSGHADSVTGLALSHDGATLLSMSTDTTLRAWDVRPFTSTTTAAAETTSGDGRCLRVFTGAANNFEQHVLRPAWSADDERVAVGSAVRTIPLPYVCSE